MPCAMIEDSRNMTHATEAGSNSPHDGTGWLGPGSRTTVPDRVTSGLKQGLGPIAVAIDAIFVRIHQVGRIVLECLSVKIESVRR